MVGLECGVVLLELVVILPQFSTIPAIPAIIAKEFLQLLLGI